MTELEAKFLIRQAEQLQQLLSVLQELGYAVTETGEISLVDSYFDSSDWSILRSGWACRCRQERGQSRLMLKSLQPTVGGIAERQELEQPVPDCDGVSVGSLDEGPVQVHLAGLPTQDWCRTLFRVCSKRRSYALVGDGLACSRLHLDFDRTRVESALPGETGPGSLEFMEAELEVDKGSHASLQDLVAQIRSRMWLLPSQFSKFERGLQAAGLELPLQHEVPAVSADSSVAEVIQAYLRAQWWQLLLKRPLALEGLDAEGVHKLRVAIRRARAVFDAFAGEFQSKDAAALNSELRWLGHGLGEVRNMDVMSARLRSQLAGSDSLGPETKTQWLELLTRENVRARLQAEQLLESARVTSLFADLESLLASKADNLVKKQIQQCSFKNLADQTIARALAKVRKSGARAAADTGDRSLHRLRIHCKRLRYTLEFFSSGNAGLWQHELDTVKELQDLLGEHQDAVIISARLRKMKELQALPAIDRFLQLERQRQSECRQRFAKCWARFQEQWQG